MVQEVAPSLPPVAEGQFVKAYSLRRHLKRSEEFSLNEIEVLKSCKK